MKFSFSSGCVSFYYILDASLSFSSGIQKDQQLQIIKNYIPIQKKDNNKKINKIL